MATILIDKPLPFFILCLAIMLISARGGLYWRKRRGPMSDDERDELNLILTSALTLLALIIGFSFSMAVGRYDLRKNDEATEANAIGTEYLRSGLLGTPDASRVRQLLQQYIDERIASYEGTSVSDIRGLTASTRALQNEMWVIVEREARKRPNSVNALVATGMNDVIDSEGLSTAAWANRIPVEAWLLMLAIAVCCCALIGYDTKLATLMVGGHLILPVLIAISFYLIADLDSAQHGLIRVTPENLIATSQSMKT